MAEPKRRFDINPGPLKLRGEIPKADYDAGRCTAITRDGLRCLRDAVYVIHEMGYCSQHSASGNGG